MVSLTGNYFHNSSDSKCQFGSARVNATYVSESELQCTSPPGNLGLMIFSYSMNGVDFSDSLVTFAYVEDVKVVSLWPNKGSIRRMTSISVSGSVFKDTPHLTCLFGEKQNSLSVSYVSPTEISCTAPPSSCATSVSVEVTINGLEYTTDHVIYEYIQDWKISSIVPTAGPVSGNTLVVVHGSNFVDSDSLQCRFGAEEFIGRWLSPSTVECLSPSTFHEQVMNVGLSMNGADFIESDETFSFHNNPIISDINPSIGPVTGGTVVIVTGHHFSTMLNLQCHFGSLVVDARYRSKSELHCVGPPGNVGPTTLSISMNGVDLCNYLKMFRYVEVVTVKHVWPHMGSLGGGTIVSVSGSGFEDVPDLKCLFIGVGAATETEFVSETEILCTSPKSGDPRSSQIEVTLNGVDFTTDRMKFDFIKDPFVRSIFALKGLTSGNTVVQVSGGIL